MPRDNDKNRPAGGALRPAMARPRRILAGPAGFFSRFGLGNVAVPRATAGPLARTGRHVQGVVLDGP